MWTWDGVSSIYVGREVKVQNLGFRLENQMWNVGVSNVYFLVRILLMNIFEYI